jgi:hypothetical protein
MDMAIEHLSFIVCPVQKEAGSFQVMRIFFSNEKFTDVPKYPIISDTANGHLTQFP